MRKIIALCCVFMMTLTVVLPALAKPPQCTVSNGMCVSTYTDISGPEVHISINCSDGDSWSGTTINDIETFCDPT